MDALKGLVGKYIKWKWVFICLFIGLVLASVSVGAEVYIRNSAGRSLDARFFKGMWKGVAAPFLIPIMIYAVVVLVRIYIDLKKHGFELITSLTRMSIDFIPSLEAGETIKVEEKRALVSGTKGLPLLTRMIITDRRIFLVSWMQGTIALNKGMSGFKEYWKNDHTCIPLADVRSAEEMKRSGRLKTMLVTLKNGNSFTARLPLHFQFPGMAGRSFS
jgi:hypothetical protein